MTISFGRNRTHIQSFWSTICFRLWGLFITQSGIHRKESAGPRTWTTTETPAGNAFNTKKEIVRNNQVGKRRAETDTARGPKPLEKIEKRK
mmetsp:Transcript_287/g.714  ORF Transcript_287/g.714 Transcript_287/m.714 type:complete len:91 (-) Transcript_287:1187-1459(-)